MVILGESLVVLTAGMEVLVLGLGKEEEHHFGILLKLKSW